MKQYLNSNSFAIVLSGIFIFLSILLWSQRGLASNNQITPANFTRYDNVTLPSGSPDGLQPLHQQKLLPEFPGHSLDKTDSVRFSHLSNQDQATLLAWIEGEQKSYLLATQKGNVHLIIEEYLYPDEMGAKNANLILQGDKSHFGGIAWDKHDGVTQVDYQNEETQLLLNEGSEFDPMLAMQGLIHTRVEKGRLQIIFATGPTSPEMDSAFLDIVRQTTVPTAISLRDADSVRLEKSSLIFFCLTLGILFTTMMLRRGSKA